MITLKKYSYTAKQIWDEFIDKSKNGTFMLKRDYMEYHSDRFTDFSLMFYDDEELVAVLPASLHSDEVRSHGGLTYGGFITSESMKQHTMLECFLALKNYLKEKGICRLLYKPIPYIYHKLPSEEDLYALFFNDAKLIRRDVSTAIEFGNMLKMPKGRKAQISRAKREGVVVEQSDNYKAFIELENSVLQEHHNAIAVHTADELELLHSRFPEQIQLWVAKHNEQIIAATVLFVYDKLVHTQYMAANNIARELGGLDLLIKILIDLYKDKKQYFDFGISTEDNGHYLNEGLIHQKEGFGGRAICYDWYEMKV